MQDWNQRMNSELPNHSVRNKGPHEARNIILTLAGFQPTNTVPLQTELQDQTGAKHVYSYLVKTQSCSNGNPRI